VLELVHSRAAVIGCHAEPPLLDAVSPPVDSFACRVAEDELLLVGPAGLAAELLSHAGSVVDEDAGIVVDQTDGWAVFALGGGAAGEAWQRLAQVPLPSARPAFVQCSLAHLPGKAIVLADVVYLLVPSPAAHHLRERVLEGCRDLGATEGMPAPFTLEARTPV
jgi:hypothetical protein